MFYLVLPIYITEIYKGLWRRTAGARVTRKVIKLKTINTARRRNLIATILRKGIEMRSYTNYIRIKKRYIVDCLYDKYTNYVKNTKTSYNLVIFQKNWDKLNNKRIRLFKIITVKRKKIVNIIKKIVAIHKKSPG